MSNLKKLIPYGKPYTRYAVMNVVFNILYSFFSTLSFIALIPMIQVLFDETERLKKKPVYTGISEIKTYLSESLNYFVTQNTEKYGEGSTLTYMVFGIIALFLLKNLFDYLAMAAINVVRNGVLKDLRNALYEKVIHLPLAFFSEKRKGDTISRISADVNEVQNSYLSVLEMAVKEPLTLIFTIVAMFVISVKLTVFVFGVIPLMGWIISLIGKQLKRSSLRAQHEQGIFLSTLEETLGGLKVVKSYNAQSHFAKMFRDSTDRFFGLGVRIGNRQNLASPVSEFMGIMIIAVLMWYGGHMVLVEKTLAASEFIGYMSLAYNILTPAKAISKASYSLKRGNAAADRVLEILEQPNPIVSKKDALEKADLDSDITFNQVNFAYEEENVLEDFSLTIKKGETVALVGQSGSGKSTIANLLTRFYDVNSGGILIDGSDIRDIDLHSLRGLMGLVTQDSILFNDTIRGNVSLGKPDASDEEIISALKIANAYEFVKDLPEGINTNIGDSGNKLSGGQKQRLSIARAVLKNPPIMILDEATSALDTESERLVQDALENMMQNRTSVVIAHRLSTIQKADRIVVMQRGQIVEQGTHEELLVKDGMYRKLVNMQSFE